VWVDVVQEKWPYSYWQTKSPLQSVWPGFVLTPENAVITKEQRTLIERLLLERISLRGICRAVGVGLRWLLQFMDKQFHEAPDHLPNDRAFKSWRPLPLAYCHSDDHR
jgi:hypothetical protein